MLTVKDDPDKLFNSIPILLHLLPGFPGKYEWRNEQTRLIGSTFLQHITKILSLQKNNFKHETIAKPISLYSVETT